MSEHPIKPVGHQVLLKMEAYEAVTAGGILLPGSTVKKEQTAQYKGTIVAFGPLAYDEFAEGNTAEERAANWGVKVGDSFLSQRYPGQAFEDYPDYQLVPDNTILGVIND